MGRDQGSNNCDFIVDGFWGCGFLTVGANLIMHCREEMLIGERGKGIKEMYR